MIAHRRMVLAFTLAIAAAVVVAVATAPSDAAKRRTGSISINTTSVGFILGFEWGSGTLRYGRRTYRLRVRTLKAGMAGIEAVTMSGPVYNLRRASDINGNFTAVGTGITVGGGVGIATLSNSKGVQIELKERSQGVAAKIAVSGLDIQLQ